MTTEPPGDLPRDAELADGTDVGGFTIAARLATGGFGTVYRAKDPAGEEVAIKVLHSSLASTPAAVTRFERESRAAASLAHPGLVKVLADGRLPDGRPWFAMELLQGRELEEEIRITGACSPFACLWILRAVADALTVAHAHGIIHRDIKASNVFLAADRIVLLDFGVAKLIDLEVDQLTQTGMTVGTPASMAPEQARGGPVDARTDVYGLGAMLFHMLTGTKPFPGHETHELRFLHQHARRPRPSTHARVPPVFDPIVSKAMAIDPEARYPTPLALAEAFELVVTASGPTVTATTAAPPSAVRAPREATPLYLLAEIATIDDSLAAPSEELWDDLEAVRAAFGALAKPPYLVRVTTDTSLLLERPAEPDLAQRVIAECRALAERLRTRPQRHPSVRVRLILDDRLPIYDAPPDPHEPVEIVVAPRVDR
ncbi:MAG TPA: serine/threonine-protein kinase [Kofleriaceae bacterium]|nr:serine/threonine-protein kinase [Kofleriaceae bacterium]